MSFLLLLLFAVQASSLNILVWNPTFGQSHVNFLGNIADVLKRDGHNVTVISPIIDPDNKPYGTKEDGIHKIIYESKHSNYEIFNHIEGKSGDLWNSPPLRGIAMSVDDMLVFGTLSLSVCKGMLEDPMIIQSMRDSHFDLGILEVFDFCGVAMMEVFGIKKTIVAAALGIIDPHYRITGLPMFPSFIPGAVTTYGDDMDFWERVENYKFHRMMNDLESIVLSRLVDVLKEYDPQFPDPMELMKNQTSLIFSNVNEFTETPRPSSNMIKYVGGATLYEPEKLSPELEDLLSVRPSTVLFSLGSFVKSCHMPNHVKLAFLEAFSAFSDVTFIWKYEHCPNDTIDFGLYDNVKQMKWIPQTDLLADPRVALFITHAGMNSVVEAAFRGKPLITIPIFADQMINSRNAVNRGLAIEIERSEISRGRLIDAIHEIIRPDSPYHHSASVAAAILYGESESSRGRIRRWAELVGRLGPLRHLTIRARDMTTTQLYSIDVILYLTAIRIGPVMAATVVILTVYRIFNRHQKKIV